ncbi:MAG: sce7726 family protein [Brevibacillus sp.]|nr:sce7726 family protein [Brevibacillus sp.]
MQKDCVSIIESHFTPEEISLLTRTLYSSYQPFQLDVHIWEVIKKVLPSDVYYKIEPFRKSVVGHKIVNDLVIKHYPGECTIKYHFIKNYLNRKDEVSTFEMNVGASRLDIGRINGKSYAYEIKTELDSLDKLDKQIQDYSQVFEFVYVVVHTKHLPKVFELVPESCGIISFRQVGNAWKFHPRRKATRNGNIDPVAQLYCLTSKELDQMMKLAGIKVTLKGRDSKEGMLLHHLSPKKINHLFKTIIKKRFQKRWEHIGKNFEKINPIDLQIFFRTEADPYWVYYKNSSML